MGGANPYFDPGWAETYQACAADAARWTQVCAQIAALEGFGSPRHLAALAQERAAKAQAEAAAVGQFETVAAYARWRFGALPAARGQAGVVPDFEGFASIEAVDAAYLAACQYAAENPFVDELSLPVRQPAGLLAFAAAEAVVSSARRFEPEALSAYPTATGDAALDCVVSFQALDETFHFCIAHRWGELSPRSRDQFRHVATALTRQAIEFSLPGAGVIFQQGRHAALEFREMIRQVNAMARRFYFYRHLLPGRGLGEQFCRVEMLWDGARFIDPDFSNGLYDAVPAVLRAASERFTSPPERLTGG
ncbi:MAG: hypothetical protein B7X08_01570 [Acidocella sp. 20-63-7]|nr:MAG: hypothetical protein B7X08_01570 [Acidocella sp. 20-63-7]HQT45762.1 hypothetical protein [Acidocella sp.]